MAYHALYRKTVKTDLSEYMEPCCTDTKNIISSLQQYLWPPNLAGGELPGGSATLKITWTRSIKKHQKTKHIHYISTIRVSVATKLCWMLTYLDGLLPIKSSDPFITWSCKIT